jgi:hypothetical protein
MMRRATLGLLASAALLGADVRAQTKSSTEAGREQFREAARVCRYVPHAEQRACMARELCRDNRDPASCEERYLINAERRDKVLEACKGKQGKVLQQCMREEYKKLGPAPKP